MTVNGYRCHDCARRKRTPAILAQPGMCDDCGHDARAEAASQRLAKAIDSIHPERRWARLDSDLMAERLDPLWWRISVGGEVQHNGHGYDSLRAVAPVLAAFPRLVITGTDGDKRENGGIGKTSFGVALVYHAIDTARTAMIDGVEPHPHAEAARMIACIDLADPEVARLANGVPFALLDDAGQEGRCSGFRAQDALMVTGNVLDRRERDKRRRTIVTTFGDRNDWGGWYGGRIVRLYWDMPMAAVLELRREP